MALPFSHLHGRAMWLRCDHQGTRIEGEPAAVKLAVAPPETDTGAELTEDQRTAWEEQRGAAVVVACGPQACEESQVVLLDPAMGLLVLEDSTWRPLATAQEAEPPLSGDPPRFRAAPPTPVGPPAGLARDPWNGLWLLDGAGGALRRLGADGRWSASVALPPGCDPQRFGCSAEGLMVLEGGAGSGPALLYRPWQGEWTGLRLPEGSEVIDMAADPEISWAALLRRDGDGAIHLFLSDGRRWRDWPAPMHRRPLHLLITGPDSLLVSEPHLPPGDPRPTWFQWLLFRADGLEAEEGYRVRGFDGRALWRDGKQWFASTADGARPLVRREPALRGRGRVETWALDSAIFACQWHRLFLDACLPPGTAVGVEVRSGDDLPPWEVRRSPRPPVDRGGVDPEEPPPPPVDDPWRNHPLVSRNHDDQEGWLALGVADRRGPLADQPLHTRGIERPSEDPPASWRHPNSHPAAGMETLEWLVTAPPGRYLWLRLHLEGSARCSPAIYGLRVSHPRPSPLERLPAFWRQDPEGGALTERLLALFEAEQTDLEHRCEALVRLFLPALAPADALPWLADFLALRYDDRVPVRVRRQLLLEMADLYRWRGTVPGLRRLLSILAEAPVQIVEGFRLRHVQAVGLGDASLGPALELGGREGPYDLESGDDWEQRVALAHLALLQHRQAVLEDDQVPCPEWDPADPLRADPLRRFYRRHAHRFTVIVPRCRKPELEAVLETAIEAAKPAHTLHRLCWIEAGFCLGQSSRVGLHSLGRPARAAPPVLGRALLGGGTAPMGGSHSANPCGTGVAVLPFLPHHSRVP